MIFSYKFENPKASAEKIDGAVFRLNYERKLLKTQMKTDVFSLKEMRILFGLNRIFRSIWGSRI